MNHFAVDRSPDSPCEPLRMLLVEDDAELSTVLVRVAHRAYPGLEVDWANGLAEARRHIRERHYDAVLADLCLGGSERGSALLPLHLYHQPDACFALMSARPLAELVAISEPRALPVLKKPFTTQEYAAFVDGLLARTHERRSRCTNRP